MHLIILQLMDWSLKLLELVIVVCAHAHAALPHGHGNASACVIGGRRHGSFTKVGQRQIHILRIVPCSLILLAWVVSPELAKKAV